MIRAATAADYSAVARLFRELGVDDPTPTFERWTALSMAETLVYERDGVVIGYVAFRNLDTAGHVRNLAVLPNARRSGVGRALMIASGDALRARGAAAWVLNVKADNAAAIELYESLGLAIAYRSTLLRFAWAAIDKLPSDPAEASPIADHELAEIERALGLLAGRLAAQLRAGRISIQLRDDRGAPVGVASFDPAFPGAFPFRVTRPELAGPLLRALLPYMRPEHAYLNLGIEDDDALTALLVAAGGDAHMHLLHLRGPLPPA